MSSNKNEIIRLYQSVFSLFDDSKQYLIIENDILSWSSTTDFIILKNKFDFDLFTQFHAIKLLCYYSGSDIPEYLEKNIITPKNGKINYTNQIINDDLKRMIEQKIIYLLISISYSKNSDKNYLDDNVDLSELQKRLTSLEIIDVDNLQQEILFNEKSTILSKVYAIDSNKSKLYLSTDSNFTHKAEGIAEYLFGNTSIKDLVELLIFHKDIFELEKSFNVLDLDIISKKWKLDYQTKWFEFQKIILKNIVEDYSQLSNNWYYYNKQTQSDILVKIERECGFSKFNEIIERAKIIFEGYFDNFKLEIDENIYFDQIALFETFLISKNNEDARQILEQIRGNKYKLGIDDFIKSIESQIELKFSDYKSFDNPEKVEINKRELIVNDKIDNIFQQMESANTKVIKETSYLGGSSRQEIINHNSTKKIFKTGIDGKTTEIDYEEDLKEARKKFNQIKGVIFDAEDVIYFRNERTLNPIFEFFRGNKYNITYFDFLNSYEKDRLDAYEGKITKDEHLKSTLMNLGIDFDELFFERFKNIFRDTYSNVILSDEIISIFKVLKQKKIKIAVLTDTFSTKEEKWKLFKNLGLDKFINIVICSRDIGFTKQHKEAYEITLQMMNLTSKDALFVGHKSYEIEGANKAGLTSISLCKGAGECIYIEDITKLIDLV